MSEEIEKPDASVEDQLDDNQIRCLLTDQPVKDTAKEQILQSLIRMLNEEYGFDLPDMERDFTITGEDGEGKKWKRRVELVVFPPKSTHTQSNIIRLCVVTDPKTKDADKKNGVEAALENALRTTDGCEFGLWTNGLRFSYSQKRSRGLQTIFDELADFPGAGESIEDLDRSDRHTARVPANDSLIRTFKRCHDYIYGNEGTVKNAFWQLLYLIFCKIYDEKRRFLIPPDGPSYRRKFWVGIKESNTPEGRAAIAARIKALFEEMKTGGETQVGKEKNFFAGVFSGNEDIELTDKGIAFIAAELSKYNFLEATVDVKGVAYETIVSNTLKQERGQFFTPRNVVRLMVDMMSPGENDRVLDPACGSGGFLVMVMDYVRRKIAKRLHPSLDGPLLQDKFSSPEVNEAVQEYAERSLFGLDFDPDLKKAARMNMVMAGDGHANIFQFNSLEYPRGSNTPDIDEFQRRVNESVNASDDDGQYASATAFGKFDLVFTNPPFGAKIPINDPEILSAHALGYSWRRSAVSGQWEPTPSLQSSQPPEILFIDRCYQFLKPGGRMAIVLPDGILGNPNTEYVRAWILSKFKVLASVDLPVETFLPQVGVQASLLFLQKKTELEISIARDGAEDYQVFMAIAEKVGKDRRGNPIYERDEDGTEVITEKIIEYLHTDLRTGKKNVRNRREKSPKIDDDLPKVGLAYRQYLQGKL